MVGWGLWLTRDTNHPKPPLQLLFSDDQANSIKAHVSIYKMFDKRVTKWLLYPILDRGANYESNEQKPWWIEKSQDFKIIYQSKRLLFDVKQLAQKENDRQLFGFVGFLLEQSFDIYKITYNTKSNDKMIAYRFRRPEMYLFFERYNSLSKDSISRNLNK